MTTRITWEIEWIVEICPSADTIEVIVKEGDILGAVVFFSVR